jgi:hypothetical protein
MGKLFQYLNTKTGSISHRCIQTKRGLGDSLPIPRHNPCNSAASSRHTLTDRQKDRQTDKQTDRQAGRQADQTFLRQADQTDGLSQVHPDTSNAKRLTSSYTARQTETDKRTDKRTDGQTDRQVLTLRSSAPARHHPRDS